MDSDREFLARFEAAAIPREAWHHAEHLRMAFLYLRRDGFADAIGQMRAGIRRLNRAHGVEDGQQGGYHETLTLAWARLVEEACRRSGPVADFDAFIARHPELLARDLVLEHYSRERIGSPRARREFVLPDRVRLPAGRRPESVGNRSGRGKESAAAAADPLPRSETAVPRRMQS